MIISEPIVTISIQFFISSEVIDKDIYNNNAYVKSISAIAHYVNVV